MPSDTLPDGGPQTPTSSQADTVSGSEVYTPQSSSGLKRRLGLRTGTPTHSPPTSPSLASETPTRPIKPLPKPSLPKPAVDGKSIFTEALTVRVEPTYTLKPVATTKSKLLTPKSPARSQSQDIFLKWKTSLQGFSASPLHPSRNSLVPRDMDYVKYAKSIHVYDEIKPPPLPFWIMRSLVQCLTLENPESSTTLLLSEKAWDAALSGKDFGEYVSEELKQQAHLKTAIQHCSVLVFPIPLGYNWLICGVYLKTHDVRFWTPRQDLQIPDQVWSTVGPSSRIDTPNFQKLSE